MSAHAYTEDQLVEQPAIGLFAELGWATVSALEEMFGAPSSGLSATLSHPRGEGASLGRETKGEVVLVSQLRAALERLNPALPLEAIAAARMMLLAFSPTPRLAQMPAMMMLMMAVLAAMITIIAITMTVTAPVTAAELVQSASISPCIAVSPLGEMPSITEISSCHISLKMPISPYDETA